MEGGAAGDASSEQECQKLSPQNAEISGLGFQSGEEDPRGCLSLSIYSSLYLL